MVDIWYRIYYPYWSSFNIYLQERPHRMSFTSSNTETNMSTSYVLGHDDKTEPRISSSFSDALATQPSFKKLFLSESKLYKKSLKSIFYTKSHAVYCPYRWSRNKSSSYCHQAPPLLQINAGKRVLQKYRKFARNLEYKRLHSIIPSLSKRKYASKVNKFEIDVLYLL